MVMVKIDSSGGITHLLNCWRRLEQNWANKDYAFLLIYVFIVPPHSDLLGQQEFWKFCVQKVKQALGHRFDALFATCVRPLNLNCHEDIPVAIIEQCRAQLEEQGVIRLFQMHLAEDIPTRGIHNPPSQITETRHPMGMRSMPDLERGGNHA